MSSRFERLEAHTVFEGTIVDVLEGEFRHDDGETVTRQWVQHPGSVAIVAHDGERVWLVRQPREATGDFDLLELPAAAARPTTGPSGVASTGAWHRNRRRTPIPART